MEYVDCRQGTVTHELKGVIGRKHVPLLLGLVLADCFSGLRERGRKYHESVSVER
jgi:hypothetical protein